MSFSVQLGLLFALATAVTSIVGFLLKYRGADESPAVTLRNPIRSSLALFSSRWYTIGIIVATGSWGLHVAALALAPISLVQSVIAGGLVLLTVIADRVFGFEVTRREWIGVGLTALGLAFLAATMHGTAGDRHSDYDPDTLALYVGMAAGVGLAAAAASRRTIAGGPAPRRVGGPPVGRVRRVDQGPERPPRQRRVRLDPPARARDPRGVARWARGVRPQPPGGRGRVGDRDHERVREPRHDRGRDPWCSASRCPTTLSSSGCVCLHSCL